MISALAQALANVIGPSRRVHSSSRTAMSSTLLSGCAGRVVGTFLRLTVFILPHESACGVIPAFSGGDDDDDDGDDGDDGDGDDDDDDDGDDGDDDDDDDNNNDDDDDD